jgi:histidine ammonia-lyase
MPQRILLDGALSWQQVAAVGEGTQLGLSDQAAARIRAARALVESIVADGVRAYGVNTGVGALCDVVVSESRQADLSRNIVMSHAVGVGSALEPTQVRAIIAAAVNNFAHGFSGVRPAVVDGLLALLAQDCMPEVPAGGSVGYLTHMAHVALVLLGSGQARLRGRLLGGAEALQAMGMEPLVLQAKEGLSLVNGTPCATGLSAIALMRAARLFDWADMVAAMTFENLHGQLAVFDAEALELRRSAGMAQVGERLRARLAGSAILRHSAGRRTQDPLSECGGRGPGVERRFAGYRDRGSRGDVGAARRSSGEPLGERFAGVSGVGRRRRVWIHDRAIHSGVPRRR